MARGCGKAQRGVTRGRVVGEKMANGGRVPGAKYMVLGGFTSSGPSTSGGGAGASMGSFGNQGLSSNQGNVGAGRSNVSAGSTPGGGGGGNKAGSSASLGSPVSRAAASAAARSPIGEAARLGDLPAQSMAMAGVDPYMARAASNEIMGRVSQAAINDMNRGNIDTSKFGPRATGGDVKIGGVAIDPTIQSSSIPSLDDVFTDERIPESLPDVATFGMFDTPGFNLSANFGLPSFFNKMPKQFTDRLPNADDDVAYRMNRHFDEIMGKQQQKPITDRLPQEEVPTSQKFTPVAKDFSKRMEGLSITPTVSSPSSPSIGSVKSADYQQIADATAARLKSQGIKATPEQINQLAFGSAYMTPAVKAGSQIQKLNTLQRLIDKGSKKTGKFDEKTLSPEDLTKYKNLSAEAKNLIDSQEVVMYSPGTSLYGIKTVPKSTGLVVDPKTGYLTSPSYSKVLGPTNIPSSIGVYKNTTFYAPNTPEYAKAVPSKILGRDMPGALADYSQYRSQSAPDAVPSAPLVSGTPNSQAWTGQGAPSPVGYDPSFAYDANKGSQQYSTSVGYNPNFAYDANKGSQQYTAPGRYDPNFAYNANKGSQQYTESVAYDPRFAYNANKGSQEYESQKQQSYPGNQQFTMNTIPVPKNFSGRMEGLNFAAPEEQAPNIVAPATIYTPVPKNFSGRMEGLNFPAPQAAPAPEVPIVQTNPIPIPKKKPIISLPPGAIPYKGNWTSAPKYIMPNQDRWGASRNDNNRIDRTARNGQATTKVNPYEPGTDEYLLWEEQYGAAQTGNVASTSTTPSTGTFASTAKNGGLVRGYGKATRGRRGVRFI